MLTRHFFYRFIRFTLLLLLSTLICLNAQDIRKDAQTLNKLHEKYRNSFEGIHGNNMFYGSTAEEAEAALKKLEGVETKVVPEVQPILAVFAEYYGTTPMDVNNALFEKGIKDMGDVGGHFRDLYEGVNNIYESRKATAEYIAGTASTTLSSVDFFVPDVRVKEMEKAKKLLIAGQKFDPNNDEINAMLSGIDQKISEVAQKIEKDIDAKTWANHISGFNGPGSQDALASAAVEYFKNDKEWGKNPDRKIDILKVSVQGQWLVAKRDVFGRVIQWRLPVHLAITNDELKAKGVARVLELSMVTHEGVPNKVEKAPPYDGYWVGNSWMMRLNKL